MAKKLFSFAITDADEPEFFGNLMTENKIEYYIVQGSAFGISKPSFWIKNDEDFARAKELFVAHEAEFARMAREKYQRETGYDPNAETKEKINYWLKFIKARPYSLLALIVGFGFIILYFSVFLKMFKG